MTNAPCKGCEDRNETCHSTCSRYLNFKKENEAEKLAIQYEKNKRSQIYCFRREQVDKALRKRRS